MFALKDKSVVLGLIWTDLIALACGHLCGDRHFKCLWPTKCLKHVSLKECSLSTACQRGGWATWP